MELGKLVIVGVGVGVGVGVATLKFATSKETHAAPPSQPQPLPLPESPSYVGPEVALIINSLRQVDIEVLVTSAAVHQQYLDGFQANILIIIGEQNVGKTMIAGRLFGARFKDESLTKHTPSFAMRRFPLRRVSNPEDQAKVASVLVVDVAGAGKAVNMEDDDSLAERLCQEKLIEEIAFKIGNSILLVFGSCSFAVQKKIIEMRKRSFKEGKVLYILINWKTAKTEEELQELYRQEILGAFEGVPESGPQPDKTNPSFYFLPSKQQGELSEAFIYWFGNDEAEESHQFNVKTLEALGRNFTKVNYKPTEPLSLFYSELGVEVEGLQQREGDTKEPALQECFQSSLPPLQLTTIEPSSETARDDMQLVARIGLADQRDPLKLSGEVSYQDYRVQFNKMKPAEHLEPLDKLVKWTRVLLPGFSLEYLPLKDPNTFTVQVIDNCQEVEVTCLGGSEVVRLQGADSPASTPSPASGSSHQPLEGPEKSNTSTPRPTAQIIKNAGFRVVAIDFVQGNLIIWWGAKEKVGTVSEATLEVVKNLRIKYFAKWKVEPGNPKPDQVNVFQGPLTRD